MKEFLCSKVGNNVFAIVLAVVIFVLLNVIFGLGGAIGGAIAGAVGFGVAMVLKNAWSPAEPENKSDTKTEE